MERLWRHRASAQKRYFFAQDVFPNVAGSVTVGTKRKMRIPGLNKQRAALSQELLRLKPVREWVKVRDARDLLRELEG